MSIEVRVPQLPESVADATLVSWHKKPGDAVNRDENLVDLETDKVVLEVPAPSAGVIKELAVQDGATVISGQLLAILEEGAVSSDKSAPALAAKSQSPLPSQTAANVSPLPTAARGDAKLSPSARRIVEENKLNPTRIAGSGRDGRITK